MDDATYGTARVSTCAMMEGRAAAMSGDGLLSAGYSSLPAQYLPPHRKSAGGHTLVMFRRHHCTMTQALQSSVIWASPNAAVV